MHQLKTERCRNGGAIDDLRRTLRALLKTNHQAEAILQMMLVEATRLFPGLTTKDHQSIVSCIIENTTMARDQTIPAHGFEAGGQTYDNVIPFPAGRTCRGSTR